jgi:hypothetical protein
MTTKRDLEPALQAVRESATRAHSALDRAEAQRAACATEGPARKRAIRIDAAREWLSWRPEERRAVAGLFGREKF